MKAVIDVGGHSASKINTGKELVLECQGSSIGTYSHSWLNEFYNSAQGISLEKWLAIPKAKRLKTDLPPIKILFPSLDTVEKSFMGKPVGDTLNRRLVLKILMKACRVLVLCSVGRSSGMLPRSRKIDSMTLIPGGEES